MGAALDDGQDNKRNDPSSARPLGNEAAGALVTEVALAKQRGWLQADLHRFFRSKGVDVATYKAALSGAPLESDTYGTFVMLSITGLPDRPASPNPVDIRRHIEWLTDPARGSYDDALIEIAFDGAGRGPTTARLFGLDEIDEAVAFAVSQNDQRSNIYIGAALRLPDTKRVGRCSAEDFYVATAVPIDIDRDYDATRARMAAVCDDGLVVSTGLIPERRSQHWARLTEPCDSDVEFGNAFAALVAHTGADLAVKDAARIMRLGGTVSYPNERKVAAGYCTEYAAVNVNLIANPTSVEALIALAPNAGNSERRDFSARPASAPGAIEYGGKFGNKVVNGRETFFRGLLTRHLSAYQREFGADPSADELFDLAFAQFCEEADNADCRWTSNDGQRELRHRASNTIRRLRIGKLAPRGLYSIETGVGRAEAERVEADREAAHPFVRQERARTEESSKEDSRRADSIHATAWCWVEPGKIPPRDILYGKHLFRKFLSATVSPGGLGKSSLEMVEALAMVVGRPLIGEDPKAKLRCWYWNGEDPQEELDRRIAAACLHYGITADDLGGRLFLDSGRDTEIIVVREDRNGFQIATPVVEAIIREIKANAIDVLIIDPFVACHAVAENDNTKIEAVVKQWMRVAEEANCAVELVHHVRKQSGGANQETTVDDARGAGALLAKARSARVLNGMSKVEADDVGVAQADRWAYFRVDNGKANLVPRGGDARWRRMVGVPLGNRVDAQEDNVGVATAWEKPSAFAGVHEQHLFAVRAAVAGGEWREDVRAANWVGHAIAGALALDCDDPQVKARIKSMIRTWVKNGVLEVVQSFDSSRRPRQFVVVGSVEE